MINITDAAAAELKRNVAEEKNDDTIYVRLAVRGGGCSGFKNHLSLDSEVNQKNDDFYLINGVKVVIDKRSALYLEGATIDYINDLNSRGFKISNPKSTGSCGCGSSYSLS